MPRRPDPARSARWEAGKKPEPGELTTEDRRWILKHMELCSDRPRT